MAQHDYVIDNQTFPSFRSDLNNVLNSIITTNSGSSAPLVTYPYMEWCDTANNLLKRRNGANTAWVVVGALDQSYYGLLDNTSLTGSPTCPTQAATSNSGLLANTAHVKNYAGFGSFSTLTLQNAFTNYGGILPSLRVRSNTQGVVEIRGAIARTSIPADGTIITALPSSIFPGDLIRELMPGNTESTTTSCRIDVTTSGAITWTGFVGSPAGTQIALVPIYIMYVIG
jgi:hypothetical protein